MEANDAEIKRLNARLAELEDTAIIDGMREDCMGDEIIFHKETIYDEETGNYDEIFVEVNVPWEKMVEIYKKMHESKLKLIAAKGDGNGS